ncbi:hypothetical protein ACFVV7_35720 [Streptomyces globisporus]|uniref:hypothetical protein n=1 Tax=Streptomyces globisporus TaxID=1908 RepID=UPI0036DB4D7E
MRTARTDSGKANNVPAPRGRHHAPGSAVAEQGAVSRVDARAAAHHVQALTAQRAAPSIASIARAAGIPVSTLKSVLLDVAAGKDRTVRVDAATRLLAIGATTTLPSPPNLRRETEASEVVSHVRHLQSSYDRASIALIARVAEVPATTLKAVISDHAVDPRRTVRDAFARKVLAVTALPAPAKLQSSQLAHVTDVGLVRRLQGLRSLGWTMQAIAEVGGVSARTLHEFLLTGVRTPAVRDAILAAWKQLGGRPGPSQITRARATKRHWATAFAWDEATIDMPEAKPHGIRAPNHGNAWTAQLFQEEMDFLRDAGLNWTQSLRRLGLSSQQARELLAEAQMPNGDPCPVRDLTSDGPPAHALVA